ncbi:MAG: hypothetical protein WCJ29_01750 [bacterium]
MFYDAETVAEAVQQLKKHFVRAPEEKVQQVGQTSDLFSVHEDEELMNLIGEAVQHAEEYHAEAVRVCKEEGDCDELEQLLEELLASSENEEKPQELADVSIASDEDVDKIFEDLFADFSDFDNSAQVQTESATDPFAVLLEEIYKQNEGADESLSSEQIHELAENLAEEVVAEAISKELQTGSDAFSEVSAAPQLSSVGMNSRLELARRALIQARDTLTSAIDMLSGDIENGSGYEAAPREILNGVMDSVGSRVMEGVFDGERMISDDGRMFPVPPNYASKSKLVEGDLLKLTMMPSGKPIFKQIGPTARERVKGVLSCDDRGGYCVHSDGTRYKVIPASVSFFRGRPGDHVVALVPKGSPSKFAAVDFIVHR